MSKRVVSEAASSPRSDREVAGPLISVQNVCKSFGASAFPLLRGAAGPRRVLTGVTFELRSGDLMILRGTNGSGKSTLMKIMSGLVLPDEGEICILPQSNISRRPAAGRFGQARHAARAVGYSSGEERSLHWRLTAMQNLQFTGSLYGLNREATSKSAGYLLTALGLDECARLPVRLLSSGQRQRLLVARALLAEPDIVLLDEPTGSMDEDGQRLLWDLLHLKMRQGSGVLVSTHRHEDDGQATLIGTLEDGHVCFDERPIPPHSGRIHARHLRAGPGSRAPRFVAGARRAKAFLRRDFAVARSYPLGLASQAILPLFSSIMLFFLARVVGGGSSYLHAYGGDYFAFAVLGEVAFILQLMVLQTFAGTLRESQVTGTLESTLVTGIELPGLLIYSALWNTLLAVAQVTILVAFSALLFGMRLHGAPAVLGALVVLLMPVACLGLGFLEGAFTLVAKRGSPFFAVIGLGSQLFGGVLYPLAVLPRPLQFIANLLPIAHGAEALRAAFLTSNLSVFLAQIGALGALAIFYGTVGYLALRRAVQLAKRAGTIGQY